MSQPRGVRRRRVSGWVLVVAFVVVPLVEIYTLIQVGQVIGPWWTIVLLIAASILGGWLIRREGSRAWAALRTALESGRMPAQEIADGALILIGGTLMLTPGFVSDVVGIALILPFTRPAARRALSRVVARRLVSMDGAFPGATGATPYGPGASGPGAAGPGRPGRDAGRPRPDADGTVVEGEVVDP